MQGGSAQTYAAVLRVPRYLPIFLANALSMWGDYIARVTIAALVYARTQSPLATATTLAVSLVPTFFGRSLVGPIVDRFPYKWVLIWSHLLRARVRARAHVARPDVIAALAHVPRALRAGADRRTPRPPPTWCC